MEKQYKEIKFSLGISIEKAVLELKEYKNKEQLVCGSFNGHMLYSDKVTDSAYLAIVGKTKEELDKLQQERLENIKRN